MGWDAVPLLRLPREHTDLPLFLADDAEMAGRAEMRFDAGRGSKDAVPILLDCGIGASAVTGGAALRGRVGGAVELGPSPSGWAAGAVGVVRPGVLEACVGAQAVPERYGERASQDAVVGVDERSRLAALVAAADHDPAAAATLRATAFYLGAAIGVLIGRFHPRRTVLGGWAAQAMGIRTLPDIRAAADAHTPSHPFPPTGIEPTRLGTDSGTLAAALLPSTRSSHPQAAPVGSGGGSAPRRSHVEKSERLVVHERLGCPARRCSGVRCSREGTGVG